MAPEALGMEDEGKVKMSTKADIWSLGIILHRIVFGMTPLAKRGRFQALRMLADKDTEVSQNSRRR